MLKTTLCLAFLLMFIQGRLSAASFETHSKGVSLDSLTEQQIVIQTKRIEFEKFPKAHNPSIIKFEGGYLMSFRYNPDFENIPHISYIGIVHLNESFDPISEPQLINTRPGESKTPSQAEDARIFTYRGRLFLIYNDNIDVIAPGQWDRRDMFMGEVFYDKKRGHFSISSPLKLYHEAKYSKILWQKNWVPFEWNKTLLLSYSINPHEVVYPNLINGSASFCYESLKSIKWDFGTLRGSTPATLVDGEYLAFFHSGLKMETGSSWGRYLWHYLMGAYTFSAEPPFELTSISPLPIVDKGFYTFSQFYKRVIFPGGYVINGNTIYLSYGKDDSEMWIATIDKQKLMQSLVSLNR